MCTEEWMEENKENVNNQIKQGGLQLECESFNMM